MFEGEQITPKLRLVRPLGPDGKSHVWVAEHVGFGKNVAVKLMGRVLSRNSPPLHRFQREADVAQKQLKSPHIAQILENGVARSGMPYLVMELLEGEDLGARIARTGPMSPKEAARLVCQLSKGLTKAHLLGLVHRNIKPGNVFLVEGENEGETQAKILDVGMSVKASTSAMGRTTSDASLTVTPEFLSPEQVFGQKDVDFRADLWALGVIAYYALTGRTPFAEKDLEAFAKAIEEGKFEPPSAHVPGLAPAADAFFAKALQRDPAARFAAAKDVADELEKALGVEVNERTSRTSFTNMGQRSSSPQVSSGHGGSGSMRRPVLPSHKEISDRLPASVRGAALHAHRGEAVTVTLTPTTPRKSSALLIVALAILGVGTIGAGLALLSADHGEPSKPPAHAPTKSGDTQANGK
jgi:eukaryotic-like serine/threonine-protein kinase